MRVFSWQCCTLGSIRQNCRSLRPRTGAVVPVWLLPCLTDCLSFIFEMPLNKRLDTSAEPSYVASRPSAATPIHHFLS